MVIQILHHEFVFKKSVLQKVEGNRRLRDLSLGEIEAHVEYKHRHKLVRPNDLFAGCKV